MPNLRRVVFKAVFLLCAASVVFACATYFQNGNHSGKNYIPIVLADAPQTGSTPRGSHVSYGPGVTKNPFPHQKGNAAKGREVFRFETFGNEGFWTDAMRLPKGMMDAKFTPLDALKASLHVEIERVPYDLRDALGKGSISS